jgi:predicted dehydrogenase
MRTTRSLKRRRFLSESLGGVVGAGSLTSLGAAAKVATAQGSSADTLGVGIIGCGGRGTTLMKLFMERHDTEIRAVSDVYEPRRQNAARIASLRDAEYPDYRELLDRKDVDVVVVATPDHQHARMVIDAVEAGKDVYVEKPLCHTIEEGFAVIEATQRTGQIVQVGTQRRSYDVFLQGKKVFDQGDCGKVRLVTSWWYNQFLKLNSRKLQGKLDWKRWLGSAPERPVEELRFFNWYYFWDYSGGLMVGQAAHVIDAVNMLMGSTYPTAVTAAATATHLENAEVPETTNVTIEYGDDFLLVFTLGYSAMRYLPPHDLHKQFHGLKARFDIGRENFALYPAQLERELWPKEKLEKFGSFHPGATIQHIENFVSCCRTRKPPNATAEIGNHTNVALCMAMESMRSGKRMTFDRQAKRMV